VNYRHAFHAGNHLDVFKHAALVLVLERLLEKAAPFAVLDTHAGIGVYDLASEPARKTGEFEEGVARVYDRELIAAPRYVELIRELNEGGSLATYPGSPEIVRRMLRADDRLIACELHPDDAETLRVSYRRDPRVAVHRRDGYEAVRALLPPAERRGLVLIDPPFEATNEAERLAQALGDGLAKWPTGIFVAWYPIKDSRIGALLVQSARAAGFPKTLRAEFLPYRQDGVLLAGGGLIICNAPWQLGGRLGALCRELSGLLGGGDARWTIEQVTPA
jgi:23S rRNA (adenine2030-N6)-methyltransferase